MIYQLLEIIAFQLLFLLIYDGFLRRETFFQWNRAYLLVTPLLAILLPFIQLPSLQQSIPDSYTYALPELMVVEDISGVVSVAESPWYVQGTSWWLIGMLCGTLFLLFKMGQLLKLIQRGTITNFAEFKLVVVKQQRIAFSFFRYIFLGGQVTQEEQEHMIAHELVHVRQKHSWDLLLFELLRILLWFNPLIYIYQHRMAELHEFVADAHVPKTKLEKYQALLSQVFEVSHFSFVNQFHKQSLIKKRIMMLTKQKSKNVMKLKYVLLLPLICSMLLYISCERTSEEVLPDELVTEQEVVNNEESVIPFAVVDEAPIYPGCENAEDKRACFIEKVETHIKKHFKYPEEAQAKGIEGKVYAQFTVGSDGAIKKIRLRGPDKSLEEAIRIIIEGLPTMEPALKKDEPVGTVFSLPITFKIAANQKVKRSIGTLAQVSGPSNTSEDSKLYLKLKLLREQILKGKESFETMAILHSEDPGSKANGGLYYMSKDAPFEENFKKICFDLKEGEISEPFKTNFGWHIVISEGMQGENLKIRHILLMTEAKKKELSDKC